MSLAKAASKIKISRKSLDDYLMLLKQANKYNFDFEKHSNRKKMGYLRKFINIQKRKPNRTNNVSDIQIAEEEQKLEPLGLTERKDDHAEPDIIIEKTDEVVFMSEAAL